MREKLAFIFLAILTLFLKNCSGRENSFSVSENDAESQVCKNKTDDHQNITLRVLSYNIHGLPLPFINHDKYRLIGRKLKERLVLGCGPDIVAIQEAMHSRRQELILESGYPHSLIGPPGKGLRTNSGLIILSRFPIQDHNQKVYDMSLGFDSLARKGILYARVWHPGCSQYIDIYNTHLNAGVMDNFFNDKKQIFFTRIKQLKQAVQFISETNKSNNPIIFIGDFNFVLDTQENRLLTKFYKFNNVLEVLWNQKQLNKNSDAMDMTMKSLDHQFYKNGQIKIEPVEIKYIFKTSEKKSLSDHNGLEVLYFLK